MEKQLQQQRKVVWEGRKLERVDSLREEKSYS